MISSRNVSRLVEIMAALRTPGSGCPWDLEQDFKSIAPYTIEEACEVADAIERNDMDDLRLELGDLLLQSVYHARMAEEEGHFDFGDVVEGICTKMIRRHPHVFGNEDGSADQYSASGMARGTWERIKAEEKQEAEAHRTALGLPIKNTNSSLLDEVPGALPPLIAAVKLQKKASKVGFDWNDVKAVIRKIREEIAEVETELDTSSSQFSKHRLKDEIGDVLFAVANLARHLDVDPDSALRGTNTKFRKRFRHIEENIGRTGSTMEDADLGAMETLWVEAKEKSDSK